MIARELSLSDEAYGIVTDFPKNSVGYIINKNNIKYVRFIGISDDYTSVTYLHKSLATAKVLCYRIESYNKATIIVTRCGFTMTE